MGFKANPDDIRDFGAAVTELATDAEKARQYVETWLAIGYAEGRLFIPVVEIAETVRDRLVENYQQLQTLASTSGTELDSAATDYEETDRETLERLDRTYPAPGDSD